jgi:hypothetical protein
MLYPSRSPSAVNSLDWRGNWRTGRSPKENRLKAKKLVSPEPENKTFSSKAVEKRKLEPPAQRRQSRFGGRWA